MSTSVATRLGMFAAVLGLGLTVAAVPAAAAPQQSGAQLSIYRDPANPNFTQFTIEGTYAMQQPDAQGYLNNIYTGAEIGGMEYLIYGDDEGDRDPVLQRAFAQGTDPIPGYTIDARSNGLHHKLIVTIANAYLNEHLQSPPDLHETSKLSHPVLTDHQFLLELHPRTLERYDNEKLFRHHTDRRGTGIRRARTGWNR